jgi:hypothetical protein
LSKISKPLKVLTDAEGLSNHYEAVRVWREDKKI